MNLHRSVYLFPGMPQGNIWHAVRIYSPERNVWFLFRKALIFYFTHSLKLTRFYPRQRRGFLSWEETCAAVPADIRKGGTV